MDTLLTLGFDSPVVKYRIRFQAHRRGCKLRCGPYAWELNKDSRVIRISRRQFASVGHVADQFNGLFETLEPIKVGSQLLLDFSRVHTHRYRVPGLTPELAQWPEPDVASRSSNIRKRFDVFLTANGFETASNQLLGIIWARRQLSHATA